MHAAEGHSYALAPFRLFAIFHLSYSGDIRWRALLFLFPRLPFVTERPSHGFLASFPRKAFYGWRGLFRREGKWLS
jgi:hypothetical protein